MSDQPTSKAGSTKKPAAPRTRTRKAASAKPATASTDAGETNSANARTVPKVQAASKAQAAQKAQVTPIAQAAPKTQAAPSEQETPAKPAQLNTPPAKKSILPWIGFSLLIILLDQLTKLWVQAKLDLGSVIEVTSYFNLVYVLNPGAAFSFLANQEGWQKHFLSGVAVVASIIILFMMRSSRHKKFAMFCLASILGGALGNLIDRLAHGAVIDFLDFYVQSYHWPAFNVADIAITTGAIGLIVEELFFNKGTPAPKPKKKSSWS